MLFTFAALAFMFLGRKLGWAVSKQLYFAPLPVVVVACLLWGGGVAAAVHGLIVWQEPGWILRWVFGYALGAYVAVPDFGLLNEAEIPDKIVRQHILLNSVPSITYIALSIAMYYLLRHGGTAIV